MGAALLLQMGVINGIYVSVKKSILENKIIENKIMTKEFAGLLIFLPRLATLIYAICPNVSLGSAEFRD